jgi:ATP synthase protein I
MGVKELKMLAVASSVGLSMVFALFLGMAGGYWLDRYFETKPLFLLLGALVGCIAAFRNFIILTNRLERQRKALYGRDDQYRKGDFSDFD